MKYFFLTGVLLVIGLAVYGQINKPLAVTVVLPQNLKFNSLPALPKGIEVANIYGSLTENAGETWFLRIKFSKGAKLMPHSHPDTRYVTVLSGTYYQGVSEKFDEKSAVAYPPGTFLVVPAGVKHFAWAKEGEVLVQESGTSPTATTYVDPKDDPRNQK